MQLPVPWTRALEICPLINLATFGNRQVHRAVVWTHSTTVDSQICSLHWSVWPAKDHLGGIDGGLRIPPALPNVQVARPTESQRTGRLKERYEATQPGRDVHQRRSRRTCTERVQPVPEPKVEKLRCSFEYSLAAPWRPLCPPYQKLPGTVVTQARVMVMTVITIRQITPTPWSKQLN